MEVGLAKAGPFLFGYPKDMSYIYSIIKTHNTMEKIEFNPIPTALLVPGQIVSDVSHMDDNLTPVLLEFVKLTDNGKIIIFNRIGNNYCPYLQHEDGTISFYVSVSDQFYDVPQEVIDKLKNK